MTFFCQRCGDGGEDSVRGPSPEEGGEAAGAQEEVRDAQARAPQQVEKEIFNIPSHQNLLHVNKCNFLEIQI